MAIKFGRPIEMRDAPRRPALASTSLDLTIRPRRNRKAEWARRLVRENVLTTDDLIWPLFVVGGQNTRTPVASMPGVDRLTVDQVVRDAERAAKLSIPCIALFPYTEPSLRDETGSEALNPNNLVCQAVRAIKKEFPDIGVLCDVALDPFTSHGHDGLIADGKILNDETVAVLVQQALVQAEAGCDVIAPSDMMDGRVGAIREALDDNGFGDVQIMSYSAKYASAFNGPFRDAIGSGEARHALSRHRAAGKGHVLDADLRLPGLRRIRDDRRRRGERLDRRRPRHDGEPRRFQARRRGWHPHLFRAKGRREAEAGRVILRPRRVIASGAKQSIARHNG